jgi:hypothetical protein
MFVGRKVFGRRLCTTKNKHTTMAKVSKNARIAQRITGKAGGRDFVKVVQSIKNPKTGKYSFKETMIHKDRVDEFFANNK